MLKILILKYFLRDMKGQIILILLARKLTHMAIQSLELLIQKHLENLIGLI